MATKLSVFNESLAELGNGPIEDTGEAVEAARTLNQRWDRTVADCLAEASWNFATETIRADADTGVSANVAFGYSKVFAKPSDWVNTIFLSEDDHFNFPLLDYEDVVGYWSTDRSPIYVKYVSNDTGMGLDLGRWTSLFTRYVELELAERCCMRITQNSSLRDEIRKKRDAARKNAKNKDAMNEGTKFPPPGSWTMARGGRLGRGDRGSRGSLTG